MAAPELVTIEAGATVAPDRAGGKAMGLIDMATAGLPVPPGFVITADAFLASHGDVVATVLEKVRAATAGGAEADLDAVAAAARDELGATPIEPSLAAEIGAAYERIAAAAGESEPSVAVRSSAVAEDSAEASFAGGHDTYLWISGREAVIDAVLDCWCSLFTERAISYRLEHGIDTGWEMAVVVQRMVPARAAGVIMTVNPITGDRASIVVESVHGLGEALVSGLTTPDRFVVSKVTTEILGKEIGDKLHEVVRDDDAAGGGTVTVEVDPARVDTPSISDDEAVELAKIGRLAERHYGSPRDLEWAIADSTFVLQCRPETTWAARAAQAKPAQGALNRVVQLLGGPKAAPKEG